MPYAMTVPKATKDPKGPKPVFAPVVAKKGLFRLSLSEKGKGPFRFFLNGVKRLILTISAYDDGSRDKRCHFFAEDP